MLELNGQNISGNPRAYLVDFGLAYRFKTAAGIHKPFVHDERRAHEGTLEFTSRDAHHGSKYFFFLNQLIFLHICHESKNTIRVSLK